MNNVLQNIDNILKNKNNRNLIIYNLGDDFNKINKKYEKCLLTNLPVYKIYYGDAYNPPYFSNIISLRKNNIEDVQQIWNMTLVGGIFIVDRSHKNYFKDYVINDNKNNKFIIVKKTNRFSYVFPKYRIIDFIIAGTMKGGTTAAIYNMTRHPDISMVKEEIHYYDNKKNFQKGVEWYKSHFDYSKKMTGDKNHDIMYEYSCLELVQAVNPQIKIIIFLRNPIERAYSHWKMTRDLFKNNNSFEYCVMNEINNRWGENRTGKISFWYHFVQRGFYYDQIQEMLKYFPIDNFYIAISEKVRNNMDKEYQKIFEFLGLDDYHSNFEEGFVSVRDDKLDPKSKLYEKLKNIYADDVKKLEKFLGYKTEWW
jgi:hypothetical protein